MNSVESGIRNFKDFLMIYNSMSESCFNACIVDLSSRNLAVCEADCVEHCAEKYVKLNHKIMALYVDSQQAFMERRIKENEKQAEVESTPKVTDEKFEAIEANTNNDSVTSINHVQPQP